MSKLFNKSKIVLPLLILGVFALNLIRLDRSYASPNLLANPGFEVEGVAGWQIAQTGEAQAGSKPAETPGTMALALQIPDSSEGSWVGVGQHLDITPLRRYRLTATYRLVDATQSSARLILRVSQFDAAGTLLEAEEFSDPRPLQAGGTGETGSSSWQKLAYRFVTTERTAAVQIGIGLVGIQQTVVEIDSAGLQLYPTWLSLIRDDPAAIGLILLLGGYGAAMLVVAWWPIRRKILVNAGLATASLILTLGLAEVIIRHIPVNLLSPNWPLGYHISYLDGQSYRLSKNYPASFISDKNGDQHLVMSNSLGVRDIEPPRDGTPIILVLGDSMTFGWAVADIQNTWPRRLNDEMNAALPAEKYHLVNAGVIAYNTFQEVSLFEALVEDMAQAGLKPKFVLLSFFSGIWERNMYGPAGRYTVFNGALLYTLVKEQLLILPGRLARESRFDDLKLIPPGRLNGPHQTLLLNSRLYFILSLLILNQLDNDWDVVPDVDPAAINYEALKSFKDVAEAHHIQPIVAYLPSDKYFRGDRLDEQRALVEQLSSLTQALDLPFIDPFENMQRLGLNGDNAKERLTLIYDGHYSAEGNKLYAKALAPLLVDYLTAFQE
jgi:hypothetical protein